MTTRYHTHTFSHNTHLIYHHTTDAVVESDSSLLHALICLLLQNGENFMTVTAYEHVSDNHDIPLGSASFNLRALDPYIPTPITLYLENSAISSISFRFLYLSFSACLAGYILLYHSRSTMGPHLLTALLRDQVCCGTCTGSRLSRP